MERVALPFSRWSSQPRDQTLVSCTAGRFFTISPRLYTGKESVWQCRKCRKSGFDSWLRKIPWSRKLKESFGPRKENNSLKGPLLNHLTSEKTKQNFSSTLMLRAGCIYLGLINPCPEAFHPLHLPRRLIAPNKSYRPGTLHPLHPPRRLITLCPSTNVISTKEYSKYPAWLTFPLSLPQTSL